MWWQFENFDICGVLGALKLLFLQREGSRYLEFSYILESFGNLRIFGFCVLKRIADFFLKILSKLEKL